MTKYFLRFKDRIVKKKTFEVHINKKIQRYIFSQHKICLYKNNPRYRKKKYKHFCIDSPYKIFTWG